MNRLDAAIRARLGEVRAYMNGHYDLPYAEEMLAAIEAVLDRHKPQRLDDEHDPYCDECSSLAGVTVTYPCRTIRDIATGLGIEVPGV